MGLFGKFFEIFIGFCFLYVEAIIYGGIFRSNCENFESKDDRNREERILFFVTFWVVFFSQTRSHLFSNDVIVVQIFFFSFSFGLFDSILLLF